MTRAAFLESIDRSPDPGDQAAALLRIVGKSLLIPAVVATRPWDQIGGRPDGKGEAGQRPGSHSPAKPGDDLAQIVGAGDPAVKTSVGDRIVCLARPAELAQRVVSSFVDDVTTEKEEQSGEKAGTDKQAGG